jgi:hypothetical protein
MPHLIFGLTNTHFLGLFGYSAKGNIMYALLQFTLCIILLLVNYNFSQLLNNGILIGGLTVLVLYLVFGKFLVKFYQKKQ